MTYDDDIWNVLSNNNNRHKVSYLVVHIMFDKFILDIYDKICVSKAYIVMFLIYKYFYHI